MHVISRRPFNDAARDFPNDAQALDAVYKILKSTSYVNPGDLRLDFPSLDRMKFRDKWWVINIGGNNLRLLFFADFEYGRVFVKHIVPHAAYDRLVKSYRETKQ